MNSLHPNKLIYALYAEFNGINHDYLAAKYGLSMQWVYAITTYLRSKGIQPGGGCISSNISAGTLDNMAAKADAMWSTLKTTTHNKHHYRLNTAADFETVMSYWHQQKQPLLIFYCIQDGIAQFDCYTPLYIVQLATPVSCECQVLTQFDEVVRLPHTFVRHVPRSNQHQ